MFLAKAQRNQRAFLASFALWRETGILSVSDPARAGESSPEVFFLAKPQRTQRKIKQNVLLSAHQNLSFSAVSCFAPLLLCEKDSQTAAPGRLGFPAIDGGRVWE